MEYNNVICHIVGLNPNIKKKFIEKFNNKMYNTIDLDQINDEIFNNPDMEKMFKKYQSLKKHKNDKFKEMEKKMSDFWAENYSDLVIQNIPAKKKIILIGNNNHYKQLSKKMELPTTNKFLIKSNDKLYVSNLIKNNLENYKNKIITGCFPINYIDFDYLLKKKKSIDQSYLKSGYLEKNIEEVEEILNLLSKKSIPGRGLYVSLKESYNLNSKIHPNKSGKIFAYSEPILALLGSFKFEKNELIKSYEKNKIKLIEKKKNSLKKLSKKRNLYLVKKDTFIPYEKGNNVKFFSQSPILIKDLQKIDNVYSMMKEIGVFN